MLEKRKFPQIILQEEFKLLVNFNRDLLDEQEKFHLDLFLLCFYTGGIALKDFAYLKWEDINEGDQLDCRKFKYPLVNSISLTEEAINIIDKYKITSYSDYVLPIFTHVHKSSAIKGKRIKQLAYRINLTLRKIYDILNLKKGYPTWKTAKYSFIAKLFMEKKHPREIYSFTGLTAASIDLYLYTLGCSSEKELHLKQCEHLNRIL